MTDERDIREYGLQPVAPRPVAEPITKGLQPIAPRPTDVPVWTGLQPIVPAPQAPKDEGGKK